MESNSEFLSRHLEARVTEASSPGVGTISSAPPQGTAWFPELEEPQGCRDTRPAASASATVAGKTSMAPGGRAVKLTVYKRSPWGALGWQKGHGMAVLMAVDMQEGCSKSAQPGSNGIHHVIE